MLRLKSSAFVFKAIGDTRAPCCWHCGERIHPLDVNHAARCAQLKNFGRSTRLEG